MAVVAPNGQDPNDINQQATTQGAGGVVLNSTAPGATAGGGTTVGAPGAGTSNTAARGVPTPGAPPNISQYLSANPNAGQQLATGVTNQVQNQANQVNNAASSDTSQLQNQYNPLNTSLQQGGTAAQTAYQDPQALLAAYQASQAQTNATAPTTVAGSNGAQYTWNPSTNSWTDISGNATTFQNAFGGNQNQQQALQSYNQFQNNLTGTGANQTQNQKIQNYGQAGQTDYSNLLAQLGTLGQTTNSANNQMGQQALLQNTVGNASYTPGQNQLDSLFLQGQANNLQQGLGNIYNNTNQAVTGLNTNTNAQLAALQGLSSGNVANTQQLFNQGTGAFAQPTNVPQSLAGITGNVANEYAAAQAAQNAYNGQNGLAADIASGNLTPADWAQLGVSKGTQLWGVGSPTIGGGVGGLLSANGIESANPLQAAAAGGNAQVATPQEYGRYNALNQLAGGPAGSVQPSIFGAGNVVSPTSTGYNPFNFNNAALQQQIQAAQGTITGSDLQNAIQNSLNNFNMSYTPGAGAQLGGTNVTGAFGSIGGAPTANSGGMASAPGGQEVPIAQQVQQAAQNGATPAQIQAIIQGGQAGLVAQGLTPAQYMNPFQSFEQYYNNVYSPAAQDVAGYQNQSASAPGAPVNNPSYGQTPVS